MKLLTPAFQQAQCRGSDMLCGAFCPKVHNNGFKKECRGDVWGVTWGDLGVYAGYVGVCGGMCGICGEYV
jgi:hypothetical protein